MQPLIMFAIILLDQGIKFRFGAQGIQNEGIAFGIAQGWPELRVVFLVSGIVLLGYSWWCAARRNQTVVERIGWTLSAAGAMSNLIDRFRSGAVIDPLYLTDYLPRFNVADLAIVGGLLLVGFVLIRSTVMGKKQAPR